ncbi:MAG: thioredoxin [Methanomicrobium sp.]|nr:thioredoxin [Methanomicrobium sp.]
MADNEYSEDDSFVDDEISALRRKRLQEMERDVFKKEVCGVTPLSEFTFYEFTKSHRYAVVDMWAEWCGPCRRVAPVIEELSEEFAGQVAFAKCNTDECPRISNQFMITAIPTLLFFSGGEICERLTGAYPKESLKNRIVSVFQL